MDSSKFWNRVSKKGSIAPTCTTRCWVWVGGLNSSKPLFDYGIIHLSTGKMLTHRYSMQLKLGRTLLKSEHVLHKCDNPRCVRPSHLFLGTHKDNMRDMNAKNRRKCERGEARHSAKLNEKKVRAIRAKLEAGCKVAHLAKDYGVDRNVIKGIKNRTAWRHV